jgi:hypothetical protein
VKKIHPAAICLVANLLTGLIILLLQSRIPPSVPLFYGLPQGEEQLVQNTFLILPPLIALVIVGVNIFLGKVTKDKFLQKVLTGLTILCSALSSVTVIKILLLVGSF